MIDRLADPPWEIVAPFSEHETVADARERLWDLAHDKGARCPCCNSHTKIYRRKFNSRMARVLIHVRTICEKYPGRYLEFGNYLAKKISMIAGDHGKLRWWGMIEKKPRPPKGVPSGAKSEGLYRVTDRGFHFVRGQLTVPSHCIEYQSNPLTFDGPLIDIEWALGKSFNYQELMRETAASKPED